jgi:hypothetical protein
MSRSVWSAVLITVLVLSATGIFASAENRAVVAKTTVSVVSAIAHADILLTLTSIDVIPWVGALAGLLVLTLLGPRLLRMRRSRGRHGRPARPSRAIVLGRQGDSVSDIARRHRMAQDAVRTMMRAQMAPARRSAGSGNSFRPVPPSFGPMLQSHLRTPRETHYDRMG